jgi:putative flippase GtrA
MARDGDSDTPGRGPQDPLRHGLGFMVSGGTAFAVDALLLKLLTVGAGFHPIPARLVAISLAMVAGWLMHRTFTFAVPTPPSLLEFLRYAGVAWTAAAVNYATFVLIVLARPGVEPLVALVASSLVAMAFSYLGMRFGAFRRGGGARRR